jgi:hypothetical protein
MHKIACKIVLLASGSMFIFEITYPQQEVKKQDNSRKHKVSKLDALSIRIAYFHFGVKFQ